VLTALAYAHAFRGEDQRPTPIVHRDLSPSNVLLDWRGGVKIADFGIAKVLGVSPATRVGLVKGTLGCMAPEQARGEAVDERADVYAAALLAWRLATGRVPFARHQGDEFELLRAMRNPRIHPLAAIRPDLPPRLAEAIATALEPDPARRTISAADLAAIVAAEVDVHAGESDLGALLQRWRPALESALKRSRGAPEADSRGRAEHTMRYEEAALAFDDEPLDGATVEAHALPAAPHNPELDPEPGAERTEPTRAEEDVPSPALPAARIEPDPFASSRPRDRGRDRSHGAGAGRANGVSRVSRWDLILFAVLLMLLLASAFATFLALRAPHS
jgi:serine/threonine protein kinase